MGNKLEEEVIQREVDDLDEKEIKINLEIYKLQTEINKRLPKEQQKKLKKNYLRKLEKWKKQKNPEEESDKKSNDDPYDEIEFEEAKKKQEEWNEKNEQEDENSEEESENERKKAKNKEHFLDSGIPKIKKRMKELENIDKENEIYYVRTNKDKIKRDYIKELNQVEQEIFEDDIKEEMIKNIYENLDSPDINEKKLDDQLSDLYYDDGNKDYSYYEENISNDLKLYQDIVKDNAVKDKQEDIEIKFAKPIQPGMINNNVNNNKEEENGQKWRKGENENGIRYEYQVKRNRIYEQALSNRNHIVKNGYILKDDNDPYSEVDQYSKDNNNDDKKSNVSQYY